MLRYVGDVHAARKRDLEARFQARFYRQNQLATRDFILGTLGVAISLTALFMAFILTRSFATDLSAVLAGALLAAWVVSLWLFSRGYRTLFDVVTPEDLATFETAICAGCGATTGFAPGQATRKCKHCSGAVLVPSEIGRSLLAQVVDASRDAAHTRDASLRQATAAGDAWVLPSVAGVCALVAGGVSYFAVRGQPEGATIAVGWVGAAFALTFAAALPAMVRATRRAAHARAELDQRVQSTPD